MSTPPPPDRPTEPLRRTRPAPAAPQPPVVERVVAPPPVQERVVAPAVDPSILLLRLEESIDALRTWIVVIGLVAVAALCVAIYAVANDDTSRGGDGSTSGLASDARVTQIEHRVDRISRQVQDLRTDGDGGDTAALANRIDSLESTVKSLSGQPAAGGTQQAVDELSSRIDDLASDVEKLQQAQTTTP
jgi:septal ring factor EnvC (AmiA/AmiB activator)